jgi:hypothetical protein
MTERDPSRLFESSEVPEGLRSVLRSAQQDVGSDEQLSRLAARLGPLLGPGIPATPGTGAATAAASGSVKAGLVALALVAAGGGVWLLAGREPAASPPKAPPAVVTQAPAATPAAPSVTPSAAPPSDDVVSPPAASAARLPAKPVPGAALPSEAELLEQARAALKGDPARALGRVNEAARHYPHGMLVQEREVIAITALRRLGRSAEADRRAEAFAKAFPGSAFQRKLSAPP